MKKEDALEIARRMQDEFKPLTSRYYAEEYKGNWTVAMQPTYGSPEYIEKHTIHWTDETMLIMYLIGYASN